MKVDVEQNIPQMNSQSAEWIEWHRALKSEFGKRVANQLWLKAWKDRGSSSANTNELRTYIQKNGMKINSSSWDKVVDLEYSFIDKAGSFLALGTFGVIAIGSIAAIGLGVVVYNVLRPSDNATRVIISGQQNATKTSGNAAKALSKMPII